MNLYSGLSSLGETLHKTIGAVGNDKKEGEDYSQQMTAKFDRSDHAREIYTALTA